MKSFLEFSAEQSPKEIFFTFGRFAKPSKSICEKLLDKTQSLAEGAPHRIYVSPTICDDRAGPLERAKNLREMFPKHARSIVLDENVGSIEEALVKLYDQGFTKVTLVTPSGAMGQSAVLNEHCGKTGKAGFYNFEGGVRVVSADCQDPDAKYLGEAKAARKHVEFPPVSSLREAYVAGESFKSGDAVILKESGEKGVVKTCGSNYLILEMASGSKVRKWLTDVVSESVKPTVEKPVRSVSVLAIRSGRMNF